MNCENCNREYNKFYGSGRFCSQGCARSFSTKKDRIKINKKVSKILRGKRPKYPHKFTIEENIRGGIKGAQTKWKQRGVDFKKLTYEELVIKYHYKMFKGKIKEKYLSERFYVCDHCGNEKWLKKNIPLEIHHKDGNKTNIKKENIELICPNCHVFTENYKFRGRNHINYSRNGTVG